MPPKHRRRRVFETGPNMTNWSAEKKAAYKRQQTMDMPIAEMELPVRIVNTLEEHSVILVKHLLAQTYESLIRMTNLGDKTMGELKEAVVKLGLTPPTTWKKPPKAAKPKPVRPTKLGPLGGLW